MVSLCLRAKNSSGVQRLICETDGGEVSLCLLGEYYGEALQIDFDPLRPRDAEDFIALLQRRLDEIKASQQGDSNE